ncbi:MAG TPA: hypothetical protein VGS11_13665 [Candidatus Bathyarchaeia archaeon]|nr:hypothetical protein [Candidatus Bathyarchaeia archaeon]
MRAIIIVTVVGCLLLISVLAQVATGSGPIQIADSATAQSVDQSTSQPINRTQIFSVNDSSVYSWLKLVNVPSPSHDILWVWTSPNQKEYSTSSYSIADPGLGKTWSTYYAWAYINIAGHSAARMQGTWEVDVSIDGTSYLTQYFSIAASAVPIQPAEGYSWPSSAIPVHVQTNQSYARTDVERAMTQWNFSQAWFQKTYALQQKPVLSLSLSSDPASPIQVSFNQTQSSSNWGWTTYHYFYDVNGRFTSIKCSISIILSLTDGTLLNDIALQDIAEHELGHCLGLWHTVQSMDLMNHLSGSFIILRYPSTLNLYALYELSSAHQTSQVSSYYSLPNSIGYSFAPAYSNLSTSVTTSTLTSSGSSTSVTNSSTSMHATTSSVSSQYNTTTPSTSASTTSANTNQGNGIPEFPFEMAVASILSVVIVASYLFVRHKARLVSLPGGGAMNPTHGLCP